MKLINSQYNEENEIHRSIYQDENGTFYLVENNVWTKVAPKIQINPKDLTELEIQHIKNQLKVENPLKVDADKTLESLNKFIERRK